MQAKRSINFQAKTPESTVQLSIITVARNDISRLRKTIESLRGYYNDDRFEHIVIDGNSSDDTKPYLQEQAYHKNFRYLSEQDTGIYDGMNKGIRLAIGRSLLFLNCGDKMVAEPDHVVLWLSRAIDKGPFDIICFCAQVEQDTSVSILEPRCEWPCRMPTSHQAMVFDGDFIRSHLYDIRYKIAADFNLYLKANIKQVCFYPGTVPLTSIEATGIASESPTESYREYLNVVTENVEGFVKLWAYLRIASRAAVIISMKRFIPGRWLATVRKYL